MNLFDVSIRAAMFGYDAVINGDGGWVDFYCEGAWIYKEELI